MLMSMKAQIEAMRAIATVASAYLDKALLHRGQERSAHAIRRCSICLPRWSRAGAPSNASRLPRIGVQVHGGMGFVEETGAAQYLRDARITTIYEGTTGIQANDLIGRKIAYEKGATIKLMIAEMRAFDGELAKVSHPGIAVIRRSLSEGVAALTEATDWLMATFPHDMRAAAAGAVPFLKLFGVVAGGWQMARAALVAKRRLDEGAEDHDFYRAKIGTARFYAEHVLPLAQSCKQEIVNGSASVLALEETQF